MENQQFAFGDVAISWIGEGGGFAVDIAVNRIYSRIPVFRKKTLFPFIPVLTVNIQKMIPLEPNVDILRYK